MRGADLSVVQDPGSPAAKGETFARGPAWHLPCSVVAMHACWRATPMSTTKSRVFIGLFLAAALVAALPGTAEAQRRGIVRAPARSVVFVGGFGPRYAFYDPFFFDFQWGYGPYPYGPWGPYGYGPYGPYGYGRYDNSASIRLLVKPKEAEVYVDGYRAGIVDSYA